MGIARILKMGASVTWVIPTVMGTIEDIIDDLKGGSRVGLIDFIQVRPGVTIHPTFFLVQGPLNSSSLPPRQATSA